MKTMNHALVGTILVGTALAVAGCSQRIAFPMSRVVPAAQVEAKVEQDRHDNTRIELEVSHLARPENLQPPRSIYVVWAQEPDGTTHKLGRLTVDEDLEGYLEVVTPLDRFRLLISAEDDATRRYPSDQIVLATALFDAR